MRRIILLALVALAAIGGASVAFADGGDGHDRDPHLVRIVRAYLRLGMGDSYGPGPNGTQAWVDKASIGGVVYDFVVNGGDDEDGHAPSFSRVLAQQLRPSACNPVGNAIIDVEQKVVNDVDSGQQGNNWAVDRYSRHIRVWKTSTPGTYCGIVEYEGTATTLAGLAPGPTGTVGAGIVAHMRGGRRVTITGTLLSTPAWRLKGNVGTFDYGCTTDPDCPGVVSWPGQYFDTGFTYADDWWGWSYDAGRHGTWINAVTGNSGNITGTLAHDHHHAEADDD